MEELFNDSVLQELYEQRNEEISHYVIRHNKEFDEHRLKLENELFKLLEYVPKEKRFKVQEEIEDFIFAHISEMSEFWCSKYYKVGFADGLNVKKEIQSVLEGLKDGKCIK